MMHHTLYTTAQWKIIILAITELHNAGHMELLEMQQKLFLHIEYRLIQGKLIKWFPFNSINCCADVLPS